MFRVSQYMQELVNPAPLLERRTPPGPVVIWNLIRRCNLTCKHCYSISADIDFKGELNTEEVFTVMDDLKGFGVPVLILSGGEPLLRADIFSISQRARDMGFYQNPMSNFGRLHDEIWRSARLVIDTGIHAKRWSREQAIEFFRQNTPLSEGDMVTEVERFFVNPGQALGYKIGMMKILELRARAQEQLGDAYDIRDFHDVVIGQGAMPMPVLEAQVDAYIHERLDVM